jgi:uncharacterized membrane protein
MNGPLPYTQPSGPGPYPRPGRHRWGIAVIAVAVVAIAGVTLFAVLDPALFGFPQPSGPYRYGPFGGLFLVFFILIIGFFIVRVLFWSMRARRFGGRGGSGYPGGYGPNRPAMVARMRYARGEITREQYDQIMQDLERRPGAP